MATNLTDLTVSGTVSAATASVTTLNATTAVISGSVLAPLSPTSN